jgi:hypothetical protein
VVSHASTVQDRQPVEQTSPSPPRATQQQPEIQDTDGPKRESVRAGKQKVESTDDTESSPALDRQKKDLNVWREQQRKLEQQRKEERERIREQIQKDREERKNRDAQAKVAATASISAQTSSDDRTPSKSPYGLTKPQQYRLQVRLFDGASVRNSFPPSATIREHVRPWLDAQRSDGTQPYTLKHILTPLPNHSISVSEEEQTLENLEIGPTANLVMIPVQSYIEAYSSASNASLPVRALSSGFSLFSGAVGAVAGTLGSVLGYGATAPAAETQQEADDTHRGGNNYPTDRTGSINIRTLRDRQDEGRDPNEFYNGNQVCRLLTWSLRCLSVN